MCSAGRRSQAIPLLSQLCGSFRINREIRLWSQGNSTLSAVVMVHISSASLSGDNVGLENLPFIKMK